MILKPRNYRNLKWDLKSKNKINSVDLAVMDGSLIENVKVGSYEITTTDKGNLPIDNALTPTHIKTMHNTYKVVTATREFAKARVECVYASGEFLLDTDAPIAGQLSLEIVFNGKAYIKKRGNSKYDNYPTTANFEDSNYSLASWIQNQATSSQEYLVNDYTQSKLSLSPWVRNYVAYPKVPTADDIITDWFPMNPKGWPAYVRYNAWVSKYIKGTFKSSGFYNMHCLNPTPAPGVNPDATPNAPESWIGILPINADYADIQFTVQKINDSQVKVNWTAPIRYAYCAASRWRNGLESEYYDIDNYAFLDSVSSITVNVYASSRNTETTQYKKSLIDSNTSEKEYIYTSKENELFTLNTTYTVEKDYRGKWYTTLANNILIFNKDGRYTLSLDVTAEFALQNDLTVGTTVQVIRQNNKYIMRGNKICKFKIVNITKHFEASKFIYTLYLLEN